MSAIAEPDVSGPKPGAFAELQARLAAKGFTAGTEVGEAPRPYKRHFDFERERDGDGNPRFSEPTDCQGTLMFVDRAEPISMVRCDACGFEGGVPMRTADPEGHQRRALERAGIPPVFREREFDAHELAQQDAVKPCRVWLREFKPHAMGESMPAPALWGQPGRGKSHLLAMMVGVLIKRHRTDAIYRSSSQLFEDLRDFEGSAAVKWERVLEVKVLALDDLGARKMTDWQQDRLFALIDHRMNRDLPLLIATNLPPDSWPEHFGDRAASRLRGMVVPFKMAGPDRREQQDLGIPF
jgi:DNA replication protein DnaC